MRHLVTVLLFSVSLFASSAFSQDSAPVRVGYLHTLAVDGHLWTGIENGFFEQYGVEIEPIPFNSGVPLAQALSGGSVDVAIMGAVISNIPSRGVGKVFLVNNIEAGTAMIFVQGDSGIESVEDLQGQEISTHSRHHGARDAGDRVAGQRTRARRRRSRQHGHGRGGERFYQRGGACGGNLVAL